MNKGRVKSSNWIYNISVSLLFLIAIFLRFWYLDRIPSGILSDELDYVVNARAIYLTGHGISSSTWTPWSLTTAPNEVPKAEFPYFISVSFVGPFGLSLFTARLGYALVSILFVAVVLGIATELFGQWTGVAAGFIAAINPWSVYYGRTAYDIPIAITAYLIGLYILLRFRGRMLLTAIIPLVIAFYSYIGTKILFIPYVAFILFGSWVFHKRKDTLWLSVIGIVCIGIFTLFIIRLQSLAAGSRTNQIFTPFDESIISQVDAQRRLTLVSPLTNIFANKPVVYLKTAFTKFAGAFSPTILFTNGEGTATYALWEHGLFYPIDAIFIIIAIALLFSTSRNLLLFIGCIIVISTLPSVFSTGGTTYVHRSSLMYPFLMILTGFGVVSLVKMFNKSRSKIIIGIICFVYILLLTNFIYLYFFRFPVYNSEAFGLSQRIYNHYIEFASKRNLNTQVLSDSPGGYFRFYLFYTNAITKQNISIIRTLNDNSIHWENVEFTKNCPDLSEIISEKTTYILSEQSPCKKNFIGLPMVVIPSLADGGTLQRIFNDKLCSAYTLSNYPFGFTLKDFKVENLTEQQFCQKFIIRYTEPRYLPQPQK